MIRKNLFPPGYTVISAEKALHRMQNKDVRVLHVKTGEENLSCPFPGALSLSLTSLEKDILRLFPSKETILFVYSQEDATAKEACSALVLLGYKNVYKIEG